MNPEQIRPLLKKIDVPAELKRLDKQTRYEIDTCILQGIQLGYVEGLTEATNIDKRLIAQAIFADIDQRINALFKRRDSSEKLGGNWTSNSARIHELQGLNQALKSKYLKPEPSTSTQIHWNAHINHPEGD